ncbi:transcription factor p65-like isoform X1 [Branchiostoma lanceolatum]|uniref:transcription factor p65-like isoform X1 n=2 Tax=Branchiostoma lanceolatum TaxID=7740 RepID=UPI003451C1FF
MAETSDLDDVCPSMPLETMLKLLDQPGSQGPMDETQRAVMEVLDIDNSAVMEVLNRDPMEGAAPVVVNGDPNTSMVGVLNSDDQGAVMDVLNRDPYAGEVTIVHETKANIPPVQQQNKTVYVVTTDSMNNDSINISGSQLPMDWDTFQELEEIIKKDAMLSSTTVKQEQPEHKELAACRFQEVKEKKPPVIEIIEQPKARSLRFRYECEGRSAGSILGENSSPENRTYPSIRLLNCSGPAMILVSLVTKDDPPKPHPHSLVGKGCIKGICKINVPDCGAPISFPNLGIQCVKRKEITQALAQRLKLGIDPFHTYSRHRGKMDEVDLNTVRLCFQAFLPNPQNGQCTVPVHPRVSTAIHDKKAPGAAELRICKMNKVSGPVTGGDEVTLLCDKVQRDDIEVVFTAKPMGTSIKWESKGDFSPTEVHRQVAIVFKAPAYFNPNIKEPIRVQVRLRRPSDGEESEPFDWTYTPVDKDEHSVESKRRKKAPDFAKFLNIPPSSGAAAGAAHTHRMARSNMRGISMDSLQTRPSLATAAATARPVSEDVRQLLRRKVQGQGQGGSQQLYMPPMQTGQLKQDQDLPSCAFAPPSQLPTQPVMAAAGSGASAMRAAPPAYPPSSQPVYPPQFSAVSLSGLMQAGKANIPLASRVDPTGAVYNPSTFISRGGRKSAKTAASGAAAKQKPAPTTAVSASGDKNSFPTTDLSSLGLTFTQVEVRKQDPQSGAQPGVYLEQYQGGDELLNSLDISSLELGSEVTIDANTHADLNELLEMVKQNKE